MNIVIYGSQYGTAKRYAEELSNRLGFELKSYEDLKRHLMNSQKS